MCRLQCGRNNKNIRAKARRQRGSDRSNPKHESCDELSHPRSGACQEACLTPIPGNCTQVRVATQSPKEEAKADMGKTQSNAGDHNGKRLVFESCGCLMYLMVLLYVRRPSTPRSRTSRSFANMSADLLATSTGAGQRTHIEARMAAVSLMPSLINPDKSFYAKPTTRALACGESFKELCLRVCAAHLRKGFQLPLPKKCQR